MILIQIGDQFYRTCDFRIDQARSPVQEDKEDREIRVQSQKHEVAEHNRKRGIAS